MRASQHDRGSSEKRTQLIRNEKAPFHERYRFNGRFVVGGVPGDEVEMLIDFNKLDGGRIDGVVLGGDAATQAASIAFNAQTHCQIASADGFRTFQASRVLVNKLGGNEPGVVAQFFCGDVAETIRREGPEGRGISFALAGPLGVLEPREIPTSSWTGDRTIRRSDTRLDLGGAWDGDVELRNHYEWEQIPNAADQGRYAPVPSLTFRVEKTADELPDAAFVANAKEMAEDTTLLMSLAARRWVIWYGYTFWSPHAVTHFRGHRSRHGRVDDHRIGDSPVGLKARDFLKSCLPRFRERRISGEDLRLPIAYWVPKSDSRYVEERFAAAFWGLEKLIHLFANRTKKDHILGASAFDRVQRAIRKTLDDVSLPSDGRWGDGEASLELLKGKVPELNRPSIATQLQWVCDLLDVTWRDLYPPGLELNKPRFIQTRNEIFHSSAPIDGPFVLRETYRVSALFERLILRTLGWEDLGATGPGNMEISITTEL
jgi:hypothetical protein